MGVWQGLHTGGPDFLARLKADPDVAKALKPAELEALFDLEYHLAHVDTIFARVFGRAERLLRDGARQDDDDDGADGGDEDLLHELVAKIRFQPAVLKTKLPTKPIRPMIR